MNKLTEESIVLPRVRDCSCSRENPPLGRGAALSLSLALPHQVSGRSQVRDEGRNPLGSQGQVSTGRGCRWLFTGGEPVTYR